MSSLVDTTPTEATLEAGGHIKGVAVALVRDNNDPTGLGRVKVSYPWQKEARESHWARVTMPMTGKQRGMWFLPEVGDEVLVAFERGDLCFPYVIGSLWNGQDPPPTTNKDGKNDVRLIQTRKGHKLTFNDGAQGLVQLELNDGKRLTLNDDGIQVDDGKGNRVVIESNGGGITIEAAAKLTLNAPQIAIKAGAKLDITASGTLTLSGALVRIN